MPTPRVTKSKSSPSVELFSSLPEILSHHLNRVQSSSDFLINFGLAGWLCVVKYLPDDAFVITAYWTDTVKAGEMLWPAPRREGGAQDRPHARHADLRLERRQSRRRKTVTYLLLIIGAGFNPGRVSMAHRKRKRSKNQRAGCLLCKPWKMNGLAQTRPDAESFSEHRRRREADRELNSFRRRTSFILYPLAFILQNALPKPAGPTTLSKIFTDSLKL
jgi:hypothetical protein